MGADYGEYLVYSTNCQAVGVVLSLLLPSVRGKTLRRIHTTSLSDVLFPEQHLRAHTGSSQGKVRLQERERRGKGTGNNRHRGGKAALEFRHLGDAPGNEEPV